MREIWKDIDGTSGRYQVSNLGNVRAFTRFRSKTFEGIAEAMAEQWG